MYKVLIADDSAAMRTAIRKTLEVESDMNIIGEAGSFGQAMQMVQDFKPDVLLLDLHIPEERGLGPELVKSHLASVRTIAISFSNDEESRALAEGYGALTLLDKMNLYTEMAPAIRLVKLQRGAQAA